MNNYTIETKRLILRHFTLGDADDMFSNWANDARVTKFMTWLPHPNIEETKRIITLWIEEKYAKGHNYVWGIQDKKSGKLIGTIDVVGGSKRAMSATLGFCIGHDYWNKGIMTEATNAVVDYLFSRGFNRVEAGHHVDNLASGKVMQKVGMQYEGVRRQATMNGSGELCDIAYYAILKSDKLG